VLKFRFRFRFGLALLFAFAVLGSGCGQTNPPAPSSSTPPPAAEPAVWVVSDAGAGPVGIGMRSDNLRGLIDTIGTLGECVYARPIAAVATGFNREDLLVMLVDGIVVRVDVIGPSLPTSAGIRVGDTDARVKEIYPGLAVQPHKYTDGHYLIVYAEHDRRLIFESQAGKVTRYRAGMVPQVDWVEGCS